MKLRLAILSLLIFLSLLSFGQIKLENLKIDTSITDFHFAADFQGTEVFTKNGPADMSTLNPSAFSFTIAQNMSGEDAKTQFDNLLNMSKFSGYEIANLTENDTTLKGNKAYYISYTETNDTISYKNFVFNAFVIKGNTIVVFTSGDLDNGQYIEKFKTTFYSIKL